LNQFFSRKQHGQEDFIIDVEIAEFAAEPGATATAAIPPVTPWRRRIT
jgi:hypothetical protein